MKGESVKRKKLAIAALAASLAVGTLAAQPAKAASTSLVIGSVLDIDKLDPHTATNFGTVRALGLPSAGTAQAERTGLQCARARCLVSSKKLLWCSL